MTYIDEYDFPTSHMMDEDFTALQHADPADVPGLFVNYLRKVIAAKAAGAMPLRDAAYCIAGIMSVDTLNESLSEEIMELAGELELPAEFVDGDPEKRWQDLVALITKYDGNRS